MYNCGSERAVIDANGTTMQETEYFPFGLAIPKDNPAKTQAERDAVSKYLYNGKETQPETVYPDYGARMYDPSIGRFFIQDRFSEKYFALSPYQYAANNPIINIDVNGDSINVAALLKSADHAKAFRLFAGTKEGRAFLNNFASKGQKIMSEDGKSVIYEAKSDGAYHKDGTNLIYRVGKEETESITDWSYGNSTGGINVTVDIAKRSFGTDNKLFNLTKAIVHESLMHASSDGGDFNDDRGMNKSKIPASYRAYGEHSDHYNVSHQYIRNPNDNSSLFPAQAYNVLQQANRSFNSGLSNRQIKNAMWNFDGSLVKFNKNGVPVPSK